MNRGEIITEMRALAAASLLVLGGCATKNLENAAGPSAPDTSFVLGPITPFDNEVATAPEIAPTDVDKRQALADEWMGDMQRLVDDIDDPQATEVMNFLQGSGLMSPSEAGDFQVLNSPMSYQTLFLAPLVPSDTGVNPAMASLVEETAAPAVFNPELKVITLVDDSDCSTLFKSIITLHEANQARDLISNPYDWRDPRQFTLHELTYHQFEHRLLEIIGGQKYTEFIDKYAQELASAIQASPAKNIVPSQGEYRTELDRMFGLPYSQKEADLRQSRVWLDAAFRANHNIYGVKAQQYDFELLYSLFRRDGLFPN